ncbi:hypothetical protein COO60DRAFT_1543005 [Scenedesmus sp. NREL 46B-D3]|nr:hypothetical protein COO60DRAFT_1543005 [Scenedesmus sp. NREL 46B-D3]
MRAIAQSTLLKPWLLNSCTPCCSSSSAASTTHSCGGCALSRATAHRQLTSPWLFISGSSARLQRQNAASQVLLGHCSSTASAQIVLLAACGVKPGDRMCCVAAESSAAVHEAWGTTPSAANPQSVTDTPWGVISVTAWRSRCCSSLLSQAADGRCPSVASAHSTLDTL